MFCVMSGAARALLRSDGGRARLVAGEKLA